MHLDYVTYIITALSGVVGAGLLRVGLTQLHGDSPHDTRKAWLFIALGTCLRDCSSADLSAGGREDRRLSAFLAVWSHRSFANG